MAGFDQGELEGVGKGGVADVDPGLIVTGGGGEGEGGAFGGNGGYGDGCKGEDGGEYGDGIGGAPGGGYGFGKICGIPQSIQSVPSSQREYCELTPPSSHSPSLLYMHVFVHVDGEDGGKDGGDNELQNEQSPSSQLKSLQLK